MRTMFRALPGILIVAAVAVGCSGTGNTPLGSMRDGRPDLAIAIGKMAPDIVGKDLDGQEFKLSDYRGKVVMLDFTGYW